MSVIKNKIYIKRNYFSLKKRKRLPLWFSSLKNKCLRIRGKCQSWLLLNMYPSHVIITQIYQLRNEKIRHSLFVK